MLNLLIDCFRSVIASRSIVVIMLLSLPGISVTFSLLQFLNVSIVYLDDPLDYLLLPLLLSLVGSEQVTTTFVEEVLTFEYSMHKLGD